MKMRQPKQYRIFNGKRYKRYHIIFDTKQDAEFDAGIRRKMGYTARVTMAKENGTEWWYLWLRKK